MLTVTFKSPIVIDEKNLSAFLSMAGVAATVEPYLNGAAKKPGRKPAAAAPTVGEDPVSPQEAAPVKPAGAKRGRKSKAQKEAEAAEAAAAAAVAGGSFDVDGLKGRFAALIDIDYESAKGLLEKLGVEQFSNLTEADYPAFSSALDELGA